MARKMYHDAKKKALEWRNEFLMQQARDIAEDNNEKVTNVIKHMKREENQREIGRKAKAIRKKNIKNTVLRAQATEPTTGEVVLLEDQASMVPAMANTNRKRQQQCEKTDFMIEPLLNLFGYTADDQFIAEAVINGTFDIPPGTSEGAKKIMEHMVMPEAIRELGPIDFSVTPEEN